MERKLKKKLSVLDPRFRKKITELLDSMHESISMLYEVATHDEKTGIYNNKFFETILQMEIEKAKRKKQKLCIMITDIDFFKKVNDKYGHVKADDLLLKLAKVMQDQVRKSDVLARFGGEEFVILLPETSLTKAKKLANRLKKAIHSDKILKKYRVTISGGITQFRGNRDSKKAFMTRSDKALYKAKKEGRDRFISLE